MGLFLTLHYLYQFRGPNKWNKMYWNFAWKSLYPFLVGERGKWETFRQFSTKRKTGKTMIWIKFSTFGRLHCLCTWLIATYRCKLSNQCADPQRNSLRIVNYVILFWTVYILPLKEFNQDKHIKFVSEIWRGEKCFPCKNKILLFFNLAIKLKRY